jgi:hypothetical protein
MPLWIFLLSWPALLWFQNGFLDVTNCMRAAVPKQWEPVRPGSGQGCVLSFTHFLYWLCGFGFSAYELGPTSTSHLELPSVAFHLFEEVTAMVQISLQRQDNDS